MRGVIVKVHPLHACSPRKNIGAGDKLVCVEPIQTWTDRVRHEDSEALGQAYVEVQKWLVGSKMDSILKNSEGTWTCALSGTRRSWILWNQDHTLQFKVPATWSAVRIRQLNGDSTPLRKDGSLEIRSSPVMIESGQ